MDQAPCWMWSKQTQAPSLSSHLQPTSTNPSLYGDSWEEQAFAEDASGVLGGCVWPPRSYSCSFCRREFRSAQALGGHMNVHRRDRARLKQSPIQDNQTPTTMMYSPNPNIGHAAFPNPRVSLSLAWPPTKDDLNEKSLLLPLFSSPILEEQHRKPSSFARPTWSKLAAENNFYVLNLNNEEKNSKVSGLKSARATEDYVSSDSSARLNSVICRTQPNSSGEKEDYMSCKRRRINSNSIDRPNLQSEVIDHSSFSIQELDLELRLGDRPKVK